MNFREFLGLEPTNEATEPDLENVEIVNLPAHLVDAEKKVTRFMQAHFFIEFQTEPKLNARVSYLTKDGKEAANERPIDDKDIDFTKAIIQSFYTGEGGDSINVKDSELVKFEVQE